MYKIDGYSKKRDETIKRYVPEVDQIAESLKRAYDAGYTDGRNDLYEQSRNIQKAKEDHSPPETAKYEKLFP